MNTDGSSQQKASPNVLLSTLWIVVMVNMLMADILSLYVPGAVGELAKTAGETPVTWLMLGGAVTMEIPILMILLSRMLSYRLNRRLNIVAGIITIAFVVGGGVSYPHYLFLATVEVVCLLTIVRFAWKWSEREAGTGRVEPSSGG